jgi:hypothetical protein
MRNLKMLIIGAAITASAFLPAIAEAKGTWT